MGQTRICVCQNLVFPRSGSSPSHGVLVADFAEVLATRRALGLEVIIGVEHGCKTLFHTILHDCCFRFIQNPCCQSEQPLMGTGRETNHIGLEVSSNKNWSNFIPNVQAWNPKATHRSNEATNGHNVMSQTTGTRKYGESQWAFGIWDRCCGIHSQKGIPKLGHSAVTQPNRRIARRIEEFMPIPSTVEGPSSSLCEPNVGYLKGLGAQAIFLLRPMLMSMFS